MEKPRDQKLTYCNINSRAILWNWT